jgi:hypothetical protein
MLDSRTTFLGVLFKEIRAGCFGAATFGEASQRLREAWTQIAGSSGVFSMKSFGVRVVVRNFRREGRVRAGRVGMSLDRSTGLETREEQK